MTSRSTFWLWVIALVSIFVLAKSFAQIRLHNASVCEERMNDWQTFAEKQAEVIDLYALSMKDASYVIGQHIYVLDAARELPVKIGENEFQTLQERFSFPIENIEKATKKLKVEYQKAQRDHHALQIPVYIYP